MRLLLAISLLLAPAALAQDQSMQQRPRAGQGQRGLGPRGGAAPSEVVDPATASSIEGMVLKATDGLPLKKARVVLRKEAARTAPVTGTTDAEGKFVLRDVPPGSYRLFVERNGYTRQEYGQRSPNRPGSTLTLTARQAMRDVVFRMTPAAAIAGRVFDEDGEAMVRVNVQALRYVYMRGQRQLMPAGSASSNDLGEFRIFGLPPGRYYLSATPSGGLSIIGGGGRGGAEAVVVAFAAGEGGIATQDESYAATYYPGTIDPARATPLELKSGEEALGMDLTLVLQSTYRVRGRVANSIDARASGQTNVFLLPREPGARMFGAFRNRATVNENGEFEIRGVAPGSYNVTAMLFAEGQVYSARQAVEVGDADVDDVGLMVAPGVDINGRVKAEGSVDLSGGNVRVMLTAEEGIPFAGGGNAQVESDGTFTLRNVAPGSYTVRLANAPQDAYLKEARFGGADVLRGQVNVLGGGSNTLELTVSSNSGRVEGLVLTEESLPFSGAQVVLAPEESLRERSDLFKSGTTDQFGKFTLRGVRPGEYKLFAWDDVEPGSWMDPDFLRRFESKGVKVKITESGVETKELKVLSGEGY